MRVMNNHRTVRTSAHQRTIRVVCHQNNPRLAPETCLHRLVPWSTRHVRPGRDLAVTFHAPLRFASLHRPDSPTRRFGRNGSDETGRSFQSQTPPLWVGNLLIWKGSQFPGVQGPVGLFWSVWVVANSVPKRVKRCTTLTDASFEFRSHHRETHGKKRSGEDRRYCKTLPVGEATSGDVLPKSCNTKSPPKNSINATLLSNRHHRRF